MRRILILVGLVLAAGLNCLAQETPCRRVAEPAGGFSMCAPEGWTVEAKEGEKYKMMIAPRAETFTPNINFKDEANSMPLADYATASGKYAVENYEKIGATSIRLVDRSDFVTSSKLAGIRVSFSVLYKGLVVRIIQYYFDAKKGQKVIVSCTGLEVEREKFDPIFDRAVRTFGLDQ
ncbi:MAG: hypothetical protein LC785_05795 [Acidobacteria bacterium]|nr:hypothetical protein [Acidobacteriota bacterium]MCA1641459.1 hypothetical protein [Acidobacteriota bacterium]